MSNPLPQLDRLFLTDGGIETDFIFNRGIDLPCMSAVMLLRTEEGRRALEDYFRAYLDLAQRFGTGFILESASWRASPDWAPQFGITQEELDGLNRASVELLAALRDELCDLRPADRRKRLHRSARRRLRPWPDHGDRRSAGISFAPGFRSCAAGADMLAAITMTNVNEAIGIGRAARKLEMPVAISFTVETDGKLPTGDTSA